MLPTSPAEHKRKVESRTVNNLEGEFSANLRDLSTSAFDENRGLYNQSPAAVRHPVARLSSESFMPIRIRRHDSKRQETQGTHSERTNADLSGGSTACYTDRKPNFRALCGSL